jgi:hemerythrin-like domain-containing protein
VGQYHQAAAAALRYFRNAAPWHTQDEEQSLFPRMRASKDPLVQAALREVDALEADHVQAAQWHNDAHALIDRWLEHGPLSDEQADRLARRLTELQQTYQRHIQQEDHVIFPLAARTLSPASLAAIGREMALRRGLEPDLPPRRCGHGRGFQSDTQ